MMMVSVDWWSLFRGVLVSPYVDTQTYGITEVVHGAAWSGHYGQVVFKTGFTVLGNRPVPHRWR